MQIPIGGLQDGAGSYINYTRVDDAVIVRLRTTALPAYHLGPFICE